MKQLTHREKLDQMNMVCPAQNFTAREVFAMYHYMESVFEDDIEIRVVIIVLTLKILFEDDDDNLPIK